MKTRIKFSREGNLHFAGHLDVMRYFQKTNRCAELPVAYSEGFYPHQIMGFAVPLGMGPEGKAEYLDPRITEEGAAILYSTGAVERLSREMAEDIRTLSSLRLPDDSPSCMSIVYATDYEILFRAVASEDKIAGQFVDGSVYRGLTGDEERSLRTAVGELLRCRKIPAQKTGKKGNLRGLDLRPMIHALCCEDNRLRCTAAQGSEVNLKPELLLSALFSLDTARPFAAMLCRAVRTEFYGNTGETLESYGTIF